MQTGSKWRPEGSGLAVWDTDAILCKSPLPVICLSSLIAATGDRWFRSSLPSLKAYGWLEWQGAEI